MSNLSIVLILHESAENSKIYLNNEWNIVFFKVALKAMAVNSNSLLEEKHFLR